MKFDKKTIPHSLGIMSMQVVSGMAILDHKWSVKSYLIKKHRYRRWISNLFIIGQLKNLMTGKLILFPLTVGLKQLIKRLVIQGTAIVMSGKFIRF